ncbi:MAG: GNAT family N-acetyltransferase [Alphaproteobacteria bacterium]|nr:GNAT family N-acetyltransferase [Alphaproteobacteria bacterium]
MTALPGTQPSPSWRMITTQADWAACGAGWAVLRRRGASFGFFQEYEWLDAWWQASNAGTARPALRVAILSDAGGALAILPLVLDRTGRLPVLRFMAEDVSDYCDLIAAPALAAIDWPGLRALLAHGGGALAKLGQVRPDGPAARLLAPHLRADRRSPARAPYVTLGGRSWAEVEQSISSSWRKDLRRLGKRLAERAPWRYVECDTLERRAAAVDFVLRHKAGQLADDPLALARHETVFAPLARAVFIRESVGQARTHVSVIEVAGRPIAGHLGFVDGERFYYYVPTYDPEYQAFSPGNLLMFELLRRCCETGVPVFDLLRGDYAYKWRLTDKAVELRSYVEPLNGLGCAALFLRRIVAGLRGLGRRGAQGASKERSPSQG